MTAPADHACQTCGAPSAPYGLTAPSGEPHWYCQPHFARQPGGQALLQRLIEEQTHERHK